VAYLEAVRDHHGEAFWAWCPEELRASQREMAAKTSYVKRFLALDEDAEGADTGFGERVFTRPALEGTGTALRALRAAYARYMAQHHSRVRSEEVVDRVTMGACGFNVREVNVCKACNRYDEAARCCAEYQRTERKKGLVAMGVWLVREPI
jgi:hypothetical protein